ncbi:MAG: DUF378 domain-containing protein [Sarcina sp.]
MKVLDTILLILVIVGALNWGLIGLFGFNLVEAIFGIGIISGIIYILVGLAGIYSISFFVRKTRTA